MATDPRKLVLYIEHTPQVRIIVQQQVILWQLWYGICTNVVEVSKYREDRGFEDNPDHGAFIYASSHGAAKSSCRSDIMRSDSLFPYERLTDALASMLDGAVKAHFTSIDLRARNKPPHVEDNPLMGLSVDEIVQHVSAYIDGQSKDGKARLRELGPTILRRLL